MISENDPWSQLGGLTTDTAVTPTGVFTDYIGKRALHSTFARSVRAITPIKDNVDVYPVLITSDNAATVQLDQYGNDIAGTYVTEKQFNVCMFAVGQGDDPVKAFVFGTTNFTSDEYISAYGMNDTNVAFTKACVRELTSTKTVSVLNISTKDVDNFKLNTEKTTASASTVILVVFMILIPVVLVAAAVIVYMKRKNL